MTSQVIRPSTEIRLVVEENGRKIDGTIVLFQTTALSGAETLLFPVSHFKDFAA